MAEFIREIRLPSAGFLYEGKIPEGKVTLRAMRVSEEKFLAGAKKKNFYLILNKIFSHCIESPKDIDVENLILEDRIYLLVMLRVISYGSQYMMIHTCSYEDCYSTFEKLWDLEKLSVKYPTNTIEPIEVILPSSKLKLKLRMLRGKDEQDIQEYSERIKGEEGEDVSYSYRLAKRILSINGKPPNNIGETLSLVESLVGIDSLYFRDAIDSVDIGLQLSYDLVCPKCNRKNELVMPFMGSEFFRPRRLGK